MQLLHALHFTAHKFAWAVLIVMAMMGTACSKPGQVLSARDFEGVWSVPGDNHFVFEIGRDGKFTILSEGGSQQIVGDVIVSDKYVILVPTTAVETGWPGIAFALIIRNEHGMRSLSLTSGTGAQRTSVEKLNDVEAKQAKDTATPNEKRDCMSHLRQIGVATQLYLSDNDECMPSDRSWSTPLQPYLKNRLVLSCPTVYEDNENNFGYSYMASLLGTNVARIENPAGTPLVFDSILLSKDSIGGLDLVPSPGRHEGGNNIAYADTHVKWVRDEEKR